MEPNYNSNRDKLILKEYGRNVQFLVRHALNIQDDESRNILVKDIIDLMGTLNPSLRNVEDFRHKLWDHIFVISEFQLQADSPYPIPSKETLTRRNVRLKYPKEDIKFRHYGKFVESLITKAINIDDPEKRQAFTDIIGNYMKLVYQSWNRDNVNDDVIKTDIKFLSNGILSLDDQSDIDTLSNSTRRPQNRPNNRYNQNQNQNQNRNFRQNNSRYNQNSGQNRNYKKNR
jgi:hypothetical protein